MVVYYSAFVGYLRSVESNFYCLDNIKIGFCNKNSAITDNTMLILYPLYIPVLSRCHGPLPIIVI